MSPLDGIQTVSQKVHETRLTLSSSAATVWRQPTSIARASPMISSMNSKTLSNVDTYYWIIFWYYTIQYSLFFTLRSSLTAHFFLLFYFTFQLSYFSLLACNNKPCCFSRTSWRSNYTAETKPQKQMDDHGSEESENACVTMN